MNPVSRLALFSSTFVLTLLPASAQNLQVTYGPQGLDKVTYAGHVLEDTTRWNDDAFHIWHMKSLDDAGRALTTGQYGWGENHDRRTWDAADKSWTYDFAWGSIRTQYRQQGDALNVVVTETNHANSKIVFDGASIYPLVLHLPRVPVGFGEPGDSRLIDNVNQPGMVVSDFGAGEVVSVSLDPATPLYTGFQAVGKEFAYAALISTTVPDGFAPGSHPTHPLRPGESATLTLSLRFGSSGTPPAKLAGDALARWSAQYPETLHWTDRRIIGTVFLAGSAQGDKTRAAGFPINPRRYFNDAELDTRSPAGLERFQQRVLKQADDVVANLKRMNAQGVVTWDIEGEEYPQDTSYVCAPDQIARVAPEMESVVADKSSRFSGQKLDDVYFRIIHDAGFKVGVCVRPQHFTLTADGKASQVSLPNAEVAAELIRKMKFAHDRWGATLFYVDSTVEADGATLPASILEQAAAAVPDSLLIPEESNRRMARATAPFQTFLFHGDTGTAEALRALYSHAFSANLVNDVDPAKLAEHRAELVDAVRRGDILMVHAGYWQANDPTVVEIYREATRATGR